MHLELISISSSKSKGCSIQYLFRKELETLIFTNTFIGFSKHRIKRLTSSSVVTGCICRDCKCSYIHLGITYTEFWLINLPQPCTVFAIHFDLTEEKKIRSYPDMRFCIFPHHLQTENMHASCKLSTGSHVSELFSHSTVQGWSY